MNEEQPRTEAFCWLGLPVWGWGEPASTWGKLWGVLGEQLWDAAGGIMGWGLQGAEPPAGSTELSLSLALYLWSRNHGNAQPSRALRG